MILCLRASGDEVWNTAAHKALINTAHYCVWHQSEAAVGTTHTVVSAFAVVHGRIRLD